MATEFKETLLNEFKLKLRAPKQEGADKQPTLSVELYENNPRLVVRTNMPADQAKNKGKIEAAFNSFGFYALMELIREVAASPTPVAWGIGLDGHPFMAQGQRSKEKLPVGVVMVERHATGAITLTVSGGRQRPVIPFEIMLDDYHHYKNANGQEMPIELAYKISARAWANMMEKFVAHALALTYARPSWMRDNAPGQGGQAGQGQRQNNYGGGGGGNYNNRNGNNYGGGQAQAPRPAQPPASTYGAGDEQGFDDDIPMF